MNENKLLKENWQYLVAPGFAIVVFITHFLCSFQTAAMLPKFEHFIKTTAIPKSELIDIASGNGFSAGTSATYLVPDRVKNEDVYNHYCELMREYIEWIEAEEIREDPYLLRSSCASPWKNKSKDIFSFEFCNKDSSSFSIVWRRDVRTPYPTTQKLLIHMGWRIDGPIELGCKQWSG